MMVPATPPRIDRSSASARNCSATWRRVAPSARRRPISERRSRTEMTMTLAMPTPPTRRATAPRPRSSPLYAPLAATSALRMSDGKVTATTEGLAGIHGGGQHGGHGVDLARHAAQVEPGRVAVEAEVLLGDGEADEGHASPSGRAAAPGSRMPTTVNRGRRSSTCVGVARSVDAEQAGRLGAEDDRRDSGRSPRSGRCRGRGWRRGWRGRTRRSRSAMMPLVLIAGTNELR